MQSAFSVSLRQWRASGFLNLGLQGFYIFFLLGQIRFAFRRLPLAKPGPPARTAGMRPPAGGSVASTVLAAAALPERSPLSVYRRNSPDASGSPR